MKKVKLFGILFFISINLCSQNISGDSLLKSISKKWKNKEYNDLIFEAEDYQKKYGKGYNELNYILGVSYMKEEQPLKSIEKLGEFINNNQQSSNIPWLNEINTSKTKKSACILISKQLISIDSFKRALLYLDMAMGIETITFCGNTEFGILQEIYLQKGIAYKGLGMTDSSLQFLIPFVINYDYGTPKQFIDISIELLSIKNRDSLNIEFANALENIQISFWKTDSVNCFSAKTNFFNYDIYFIGAPKTCPTFFYDELNPYDLIRKIVEFSKRSEFYIKLQGSGR